MVNGPIELARIQFREIFGAYSCLPRIGARPLICVPRAARTCWELSETRSSIVVIISFRSVVLSNREQNPCYPVSMEAMKSFRGKYLEFDPR
jgi:hypothetical protein